MMSVSHGGSRRGISWLCAGLTLAGLLGLAGCGFSGGPTGDEENDPNIQTAQVLRKSGDYPEAERAFLRALRNNPHSATAHYELALLYYTKMTNYVGALYHFQEFRGLRPRSGRDDVLKLMVDECKRELAKDVPLGSISVQMQREIDRLKGTNAALQQELTQLKLLLAQRPAAAPSPAEVAPSPLQSPPADSGAGVQRVTGPRATAPSAEPAAGAPALRMHTIRSGETIAAVSRRYGVPIPSILAANPGVDPRRLQPGQVIKVPMP